MFSMTCPSPHGAATTAAGYLRLPPATLPCRRLVEPFKRLTRCGTIIPSVAFAGAAFACSRTCDLLFCVAVGCRMPGSSTNWKRTLTLLRSLYLPAYSGIWAVPFTNTSQFLGGLCLDAFMEFHHSAHASIPHHLFLPQLCPCRSSHRNCLPCSSTHAPCSWAHLTSACSAMVEALCCCNRPSLPLLPQELCARISSSFSVCRKGASILAASIIAYLLFSVTIPFILLYFPHFLFLAIGSFMLLLLSWKGCSPSGSGREPCPLLLSGTASPACLRLSPAYSAAGGFLVGSWNCWTAAGQWEFSFLPSLPWHSAPVPSWAWDLEFFILSCLAGGSAYLLRQCLAVPGTPCFPSLST